MILIDSNVLLDISSNDPIWFDWSAASIAELASEYALCINPIIYAEASVKFNSPADFDRAFAAQDFIRENLPYSAAFLAGKAHASYRRRGGSRISTLPDFFIGAHALVSGYSILTRDTRRLRRYFPSVQLIAP
jgi:predicted nucleic acid-binding protein